MSAKKPKKPPLPKPNMPLVRKAAEIVAAAIQDGAVTMLVVWQTSDSRTVAVSLPPGRATMVGLHDGLTDMIHPQPKGAHGE